MRLVVNKRTSEKVIARRIKKARVRKTVNGTGERPRLSVFRSARHLYAQIIDDTKGVTLCAASSLEAGINKKGVDNSKKIGTLIAEKAKAKNIMSVVFDRSGYRYRAHSRSEA